MYIAVDVDGTLTTSNVSFAFGKFLYRQGMISLWQACVPIVCYAAHAVGLLSLEYLHRRIFRTLFYGRNKAQIERAVDTFLDLQGQQLLRRSISDELALFRRQGARLALLSSSPDFLVEKLAKMLAIQEWAATEYIVDGQGLFSSIGQVVTGAVKADIVKVVKHRDGGRIVAMTDSMVDIPLLEAADEVIAVYPDRRLRRTACKRGWRVVDGG